MSKLSLLKFLVSPREVTHGLRRLGPRGALTHGMRRVGTMLERPLLGPAQLRINPMGAICNHKCPMCWLQHLPLDEYREHVRLDKAERMGLDDYRTLFDGMPRGLTEVNVVGGGEPLVHPECPSIMRLVKERGWRGYLMSNGSLLDESVAGTLVDIGWDTTRISTHAGDRDTYRTIHGVDNFDRVRENLLRFRARRDAAHAACSLGLHFVLQRENLETIPAMFALGEECGADHLVFEIVFALSPSFRLTKREHARAAELLRACDRDSDLHSNAEQIAASHELEAIDAPTVAALPRPRLDTAPPPAATAPTPAPSVDTYRPANRCSVGFDSAFVTARGDVMPCCFSDEVMGNVREQSFREIWFGARYAAFRTRLIRGEFADYCGAVRCKLRSFLHD